MNKAKVSRPTTFRGRYFGIATLVALQYAIGGIHLIFGVSLLLFGTLEVYSVYTLVFSVLVTAFAYGLWKGKKSCWIGTVLVSVFVVVADVLVLLNLPSVPGIPKAAGFGEIPYGIAVTAYLFRAHIRATFRISAVGFARN